ncbi:hypothetical protein [Ralstonia pseudosolanacearum]|uniref:hypothetical protein n=1 Tax=Ralstonia pseudosolanacearum TaxID=1310165 RepID=UPI0018D1137C|nr:hypothetical protein [Ralstonia pseudosolanacearum]
MRALPSTHAVVSRGLRARCRGGGLLSPVRCLILAGLARANGGGLMYFLFFNIRLNLIFI